MYLARQIFSILRIHGLPYVFILTVVLGIPGIGNAQIKPADFNDFKHYTEEHGLPSAYLQGIQEDKNGFLWIATSRGISRYDGAHFTNFMHIGEDSIKHEMGFISSFVIDESGENIWISNDDGIFSSSVDTLNFQKIETLIPSINISVGKANDLLLDDQNQLWAASATEGIYRFDLKGNEHEIISFVSNLSEDNSLINSSQCIFLDPSDKNIVWIGTLAGIIRFNNISKKYQVYVYENEPEMAQNRIRRIHVSEDEVFLGTWSKGLLIFDKHSKQFRDLMQDKHTNQHLLILDLYLERDTNLWISTKDGLMQYNLNTNSVQNIIDHKEATGILKGVSYIDSRSIIWFCTGKGLFKFDPQQSHYTFIELEKRSGVQPSLLVRRIIQSEGYYYVLGYAGSGLYKIDAEDHSFEVIDYPYLESGKGPNTSLRDMVKMENGNFLVVSSEITIFDPETRQIKLSPLQIDHPFPSTQTLVRDKNYNYWIGTRAAGLFLLNLKNNNIKCYKDEFNEYQEGGFAWINNLYIDSQDKLWIGKGSSSVMDMIDTSIICLNHNIKESIVFYQDVYEFCEDKTGKIWMAGGPDGLGFTTFENIINGVSHQVDGYFSGVYAYNDSLLWTTGQNLGTFNIHTMSHHEIKLNANNKKLRVSGPIISAGDGEYIIGCDNGILIYNPEKQIISVDIPVPYISEIVSDGKTFYEGNSLTINSFDLNSRTKHLVFKISSLGFHFSDQITYQYRFDDEWQDIGSNSEIHLTNLSHGDYTLEIKACNNLGIWNEIPKIYNISILTPWWATWWAIILYLGLAILFADRFYRFQLAKRLAIAESKRLKEVNQLKSSLYANITHEFRTPLTVILGMVESVTTNINDNHMKGTEHALDMIKRNGKSLLRLVSEMLDLSKLESGKMELQLIQSNVIPFVKYLCEGFHSLAQEKQINFTEYFEIDELSLDFDANKLSSIISNVLSNAIKFTPFGGNIIVHLNRIFVKNKEVLIIKIKDSGPGIPEEEVSNIFDRFYQVDKSSSQRSEGTGIGLALSKEFIELMNGSIEVKSKEGEGSEFIIRLPVRTSALQTNDIQINLDLNLAADVSMEESTQVVDQPELPLALIIEDNADVAHYLKTCLAGKYQTMHSANGEIGINVAIEKIPDIIICDIMMPVKDGLEVCTTLKADERTDHIPVILLTAKVAMKDKLTGLSCGADAYLTKPFVKAELLTRLDQLVLLRKRMMQKIETNSFSHFMKVKAENPEAKFLQKIVKIIHDEISNHSFGSSIHLSHKMHLSESQIYRKLKAITGKSTAVFIRSVRLQKAKELIQTTDKTISEIAYEVGFNDPSWFGRAFKEEFGFTPGAISK